jgi:hypothetical protein
MTSPGVVPEQVVSLLESINNPNISIPDHGTDSMKCYIIGAQLPSTFFTVFVYLYGLESARAVVFASDPFEVPLESYTAVEGESIQFAESMGFMLDRVNLGSLTAEEQHQLAVSLPFFRVEAAPADAEAALGGEPEQAQADAVARLLSTF